MTISIRTESQVAANRIGDFEALQQRGFDLSRDQPGFQGGALLCSRSRPLIYTRISLWDDLGAVRAFWKGEAFRDFAAQAQGENISTFTRPLEAYDMIEVVRDPGTPTVVTMIERTIKPGTFDAFLESRKEFFRLQRSEGAGAVTSAVSRLAGSQNRVVSYLSYLSQEDANRFLATPACQAWQAQHLAAYDAEPATIESYEPVIVLAPVQA